MRANRLCGPEPLQTEVANLACLCQRTGEREERVQPEHAGDGVRLVRAGLGADTRQWAGHRSRMPAT
jgi:hypothetical protein